MVDSLLQPDLEITDSTIGTLTKHGQTLRNQKLKRLALGNVQEGKFIVLTLKSIIWIPLNLNGRCPFGLLLKPSQKKRGTPPPLPPPEQKDAPGNLVEGPCGH